MNSDHENKALTYSDERDMFVKRGRDGIQYQRFHTTECECMVVSVAAVQLPDTRVTFSNLQKI
jgi:hypothetical protein